MPTADHTLPTGETICVYHATNAEGWAGKFFNGKRAGFIGELTLHNYKKKIPDLQAALIAEIEEAGIVFDAVVCPPSKGTDIEPYRQAILERWPVHDFTPNFTRKGQKRAVRLDTTVADMIAEFAYTPDGKEGEVKSLLVIDESVASGKTLAAVLHHLRTNGLPADAHVASAACCKMG
jgi:hypothetical protein